ncbi:hypothetical protein C3747_126g509c [Trypanosoma cruzi]|uniref:Uncharacterized protein n=2 Tax=Trypanosoma cruzi TaxID=5693 RepID=Q4CQF6_TRYCC|nr:hypothetical protein, conserved [Trypanosoma cruzi]EAN82509.1 hypothetical protein, conserved [Trypanosoma cruzi]PWV05673.1 hypothetical protein C3747_126g509c [Trypanosoma cruzi]RNC45459.1 hypothetical protein TcCL_NonESM04798 [Trypanosoma cruzi]|eukprot:XP_804360.1 hypothetical protein [Trypanosoma cruzi strain CL Brener]
MDYNLEYSEEQREYLERVGMREYLETFVAEVVRQKPNDIYAFLHDWASAHCQKQTKMTPTEASIKIQCAQRQNLAIKEMRSRQRKVNELLEQEETERVGKVEMEG